MKIIAIGASAGGSRALAELLRHLPESYPFPVLVVKHHSASEGVGDGSDIVKWLKSRVALDVRLAEDKTIPVAGTVTIAPPDYHLLLNADRSLSLSQDAPVLYARPSVDVLFESVADACGEDAVGIVLTGASRDGAEGVAAIRRANGHVFVQNPCTAEASIMPRAALADSDTNEAMELNCLALCLLELASSSCSSKFK